MEKHAETANVDDEDVSNKQDRPAGGDTDGWC